jgi:DNA modification methylase
VIINQGAADLVAMSKLECHPRNVQEGDVGAIYRSIMCNGFYGALVAQQSTGYVLVGNHRLRAAQLAGLARVPVFYVDVSDEQALRIMLADNRTAELATRDEEALFGLLRELVDGEGLDGTGYDEHDLDAMLADLAAGDPTNTVDPGAPLDRADELRDQWGTAAGQVWVAGEHRIVCGDATDPATAAALLAGEEAVCLWTDPPYGVDYVGKTKDALRIKNDSASGLPSLLAATFAAIDVVMAASARFYIAAPAGPRGTDFRIAIGEAGWMFHQALVWVKDSMVLGHSDYHYRHEDVLYGWKPGPGRPGRGNHVGTRWYGDHAQTSVLEIRRPKRSEHHPTMKPVELVEACLANSTRRGDVVVDCFLGSGSTIVACQRLGRRGYGVELDPRYLAATLQRLNDMGVTPILAE